jgi:hypothetical protein
MTDRTKEIEDEIKKCNEYHLLDIRCDVIDSNGKYCNEPVEPSIDIDARSSSDNNFKWEYQRCYHTGFSCKYHGSVPISINGEPQAINTPEEVFGEFKEVLQAELKGRQESRKEILKEVEKRIDELKCYCEMCDFEGEHKSDEDDKLIKSLDLKQQLTKLKEKKEQ